MKKTDLPEILRKTIALAEKWQNRANTLRTKDELKQQQMMRRLLNHPSDKTVVMHLVDQSFRSGRSVFFMEVMPDELAKSQNDTLA